MTKFRAILTRLKRSSTISKLLLSRNQISSKSTLLILVLIGLILLIKEEKDFKFREVDSERKLITVVNEVEEDFKISQNVAKVKRYISTTENNGQISYKNKKNHTNIYAIKDFSKRRSNMSNNVPNKIASSVQQVSGNTVLSQNYQMFKNMVELWNPKASQWAQSASQRYKKLLEETTDE